MSFEEAGFDAANLASKNLPVDPLDWGRPGKLTNDEVAVFSKFRDEVEKRGGDFRETVYCFGEEEGEAYALCRWLRARKFVYEDVIKMVEEAVECRSLPKKSNFHPDPKAALGVDPHIYIAQYPQFYYGNGKNGCPLYISKPGRLNINALECLTTFPNIFKYHWYVMVHDFGSRLRANKAKNENFKRFECNIVLDLGELSVAQLNSRTLNVIKEQTFIDSLCFPETMSKTIIINAPRFFTATWKIIKGWIDPRTVNKIEIISSRKVWEKRLLELVDADNLPADYGGTGPKSQEIILNDNSTGGVTRYHTELLTVRSSTSTVFELEAGEKMDVIVFCKAKSGGKFSILDADKVKDPYVENVDVTYKGSSDTDNSLPEVVTLTSGLAGPGKFKIKAESNSGRMYSDNFLVVFNVFKN